MEEECSWFNAWLAASANWQDGMEGLRNYIVQCLQLRALEIVYKFNWLLHWQYCACLLSRVLWLYVGQIFILGTADSFASECSSYFSRHAWHLYPCLQSAISTAGLVVFSFQKVKAHSSLPGACMQAIVLPALGSTLRGNGTLTFFYFGYGRVLLSLDSTLFGFYAAELLQAGLAGMRDSILGLTIDLLDLIGWAERLIGRIYRAFAARRATRGAPCRLFVLAKNALGCGLSLMRVLSIYHFNCVGLY